MSERRKARRRLKSPAAGAYLRWGYDCDGEGPDLVAGYAPGCRGIARTLAFLFGRNSRAVRELEEAGADLTTLRITIMPKPEKNR